MNVLLGACARRRSGATGNTATSEQRHASSLLAMMFLHVRARADVADDAVACARSIMFPVLPSVCLQVRRHGDAAGHHLPSARPVIEHKLSMMPVNAAAVAMSR